MQCRVLPYLVSTAEVSFTYTYFLLLIIIRISHRMIATPKQNKNANAKQINP